MTVQPPSPHGPALDQISSVPPPRGPARAARASGDATGRRRLLRADEALRELDVRLAHDLRGPIASARGLASIVREALAEGDVPEAERASALLERSLAGLDGLVGELSRTVRRGRSAVRTGPADTGASLDGAPGEPFDVDGLAAADGDAGRRA